MLFIFLQNRVPIVDGDDLACDYGFQSFDAGQSTSRVGMGFTPVSDYRNIGIHDEWRHPDCFILLFKEAAVIAAISPISSPKNFSGQFSISPHSFRAKSATCALP